MPQAEDRCAAPRDPRTFRPGAAVGAVFAGEAGARQLGPMVMFERRRTGRGHERPARIELRNDPGQFVLQLLLSGEFVGGAPDNAVLAGPGDIVVFDAGRPHRARFKNAHILAVSIPQDELRPFVEDCAGLHGIVLKTPASALLGDMMVSLDRHLVRLGPREIAGAVQAFRELLAIALMPSPGKDAARAGTFDKFDQARAAIERRLASPGLSPAAIASEIGLSRSRLYELFRPFGGVASHIQERRAVRLKALLEDPLEPRSIAALAFAVGFASESHASRTFRQMFGAPPGQFRREMRGAAATSALPFEARPPQVSLVAAPG
ncbi:helix-turn-helix domain-containing protein [Aurantimonas sp. VKM B-3413]|nr:helix-turn-helix domain-containing protein [Aurantimonas sp. VKM B-3413]MCB8836524.1 helix-turn-helix domain-containing protein [Aurantimonas sp. VKM B-3413]